MNNTNIHLHNLGVKVQMKLNGSELCRSGEYRLDWSCSEQGKVAGIRYWKLVFLNLWELLDKVMDCHYPGWLFSMELINTVHALSLYLLVSKYNVSSCWFIYFSKFLHSERAYAKPSKLVFNVNVLSYHTVYDFYEPLCKEFIGE
jgi:hypothetical protein